VLLENAEARRAAALRVLHRHREALAPEAQQAAQRVEHAEFRTLEDDGDRRFTTCVVERKIAANRANARRSTAPTTAAGRARSARNAVRHGLSVPVLADPERRAEAMALRPASAAPRSWRLRSGARPSNCSASVNAAQLLSWALASETQESSDEREAHALADIAVELMRLDVHERRALSRQTSAIRAFDCARAALPWRSPMSGRDVFCRTKPPGVNVLAERSHRV
jgi:hypothetical protein